MHVLLIMLLASGAGQASVVPNTPNTVRLADGAARPAATVADLAWLTGAWPGEGLGGAVDEAWSAPAGGAMVGHFRLVKDGKPVFYEILTILEREGSVEIRLKHVNADMTGWEEKHAFTTFRLAKLEAGAAWFNGLTFKRIDGDRMEIYLALRAGATGELTEHAFALRRAR